MRVLKRSGVYEDISFDKVLRRLRKLCEEGIPLKNISPDEIAQRVCSRIYDGVKTTELDELASQMCASLVTNSPEYGTLASRIVISNHHKNTLSVFSDTMNLLYNAKDVHGNNNGLISEELYDIINKYKEIINNTINYNRDYDIDYFGFKTLEKSYLLKINGILSERPQDMWMRVALGIHGYDIEDALESYELMSKRYFTHATPTLFNAGTPRPQLSSCYLLSMHDSVTGMYKTLGDCAQISKYAGGIGVHIHTIRAKGSHIRGTNGISSGIIPMLRVFNNTARHINQAGKRNGSIAIYLEPWHADIEAFLDLRKNNGSEEDRCRDLFTAMWIPDLFMERVQSNGDWSLMCPDICPGLSDAIGDDFKTLYEHYENNNKFIKKIKAQTIWIAIIKSQIETGTPYLCYKDSANKKSNQKNLGTIKSSNLCVAPETKILTSEGYKTIRDLVNTSIKVWNGSEWSETTIKKTSDNSELLRISFSNGSVLECTLYHKFHIQIDYNKTITKDAIELIIGDKLIKWSPPTSIELDKDCKQDNHDYVNVKLIERTCRFDETYCFNEPKRHMGIFNGVITGNCSEIIEYSNDDEYAVCNLASISLPAFIENGTNSTSGNSTSGSTFKFNLEKLHKVSQLITKNLNKVIDKTFYPVPETSNSNLKHRPIGLGVQGLADCFAIMRFPFDSPEAAKLNRDIFETIYHGALTASVELSKKNGSYSSFNGSPASQGLLQFDLWGKQPEGNWDWDCLKKEIVKYGLRNSLLLAPMPTASTSQILGNTECFEPITSNIFQRQSMAGDFTIINKHLINDLLNLGLWNIQMKDRILTGGGSIQHIDEIPNELKMLYKTAWEIKQKVLIDQAADRGIYICQSQSLNLFVEDPDISKISNMHFYAWKAGLKTGCYYLRTRPKARMSSYTLEPPVNSTPIEAQMACRRDNPEGCVMCSG
jgi:ribonucleotide reductase alpha subunit